MKALICPNCGAEVYPQRYGDSSFTCFNCETVVSQISLRRKFNNNIENYAEEGNTSVRNLETEVP